MTDSREEDGVAVYLDGEMVGFLSAAHFLTLDTRMVREGVLRSTSPDALGAVASIVNDPARVVALGDPDGPRYRVLSVSGDVVRLVRRFGR
ncbi:MAG: hypothetical protein ABMB14_30555 [Myxococcota bacterium]